MKGDIFSLECGEEGRGEEKTRDHAELKEEKADLFLKGKKKKMLKASKHFVICDFFSPHTLPKGLSAKLHLMIYLTVFQCCYSQQFASTSQIW